MMNRNWQNEALLRQRSYDLGYYEAVMHRTKIGDKLRSETQTKFNQSYSGMLGHLQQTVRRDQEPYRRGYRVGTLKCTKLGYTVKRAQGMALVPHSKLDIDLQYTDNSVYKNLAQQFKILTKQKKSAKNDYVVSMNLSRRETWNNKTQDKNWDKLVKFYRLAMRQHNTKIDLNFSRFRAQDYLENYYAKGLKVNTAKCDETWQKAYNATAQDLLMFHPELNGNAASQKSVCKEMNPAIYLASPAYFDKNKISRKLADKHGLKLGKALDNLFSKFRQANDDITAFDERGGGLNL